MTILANIPNGTKAYIPQLQGFARSEPERKFYASLLQNTLRANAAQIGLTESQTKALLADN